MNEKIMACGALDLWIVKVLGEKPKNVGNIETEGWFRGVFGDRVAIMKKYPDKKSPEILKDIWRERGAPEEDVDKMGVLLVRYSNEWGYSKIYAYPLGCVD